MHLNMFRYYERVFSTIEYECFTILYSNPLGLARTPSTGSVPRRPPCRSTFELWVCKSDWGGKKRYNYGILGPMFVGIYIYVCVCIYIYIYDICITPVINYGYKPTYNLNCIPKYLRVQFHFQFESEISHSSFVVHPNIDGS